MPPGLFRRAPGPLRPGGVRVFFRFSSCFPDFSDYASYYCRISCVFLSALCRFLTLPAGVPASEPEVAPHFPGLLSPVFPAFPGFLRLRPEILLRARSDLHKISHKKLLRRVIHIFHRVFHIGPSLDFRAFRPSSTAFHSVPSRLCTVFPLGFSLHNP